MTLRIVRDAMGLSQNELDKLAGLPRGTVHDVESGRNGNPTITVCKAITDALRTAGAKGVELEELFSTVKVAR